MKKYILTILTAFILAGCGLGGAVSDQYKDISVAVGESIYTKKHALDESGLDNPNYEKLARLMTPVDGPMGSLVRFVSDRDVYPNETWVELLFVRYPWINTLFIVDQDGWMLDRYPYDPIKRISEPIEFEAVWRQTFIQTRVDYPELGPELYLGTPIFEDSEFKGLIVVSFDPRTLFAFCPEPEELVIIHPGGGVWSQNENLDKDALKAVDWKDIIADDVLGYVEAGGTEFTWLVRYVGKEPYLYATPSAEF